MKIWQVISLEDLTEEIHEEFALLHGSKYWPPVYKDEDVLNRDEPMHVHFSPGSSAIAEFTWVWGMNVCVTEEVSQRLKQFKGWTPLPILITQPEKKKNSKPIVPYPYTGSELKLLWITHWVTMNETWSTFTRRGYIPGEPDIIFHGIEEVDREWIPSTGKLKATHRKRQAGMGIFIEKSELGDNDFFRLRQWPGQQMCTDRVRDFCIAEDYRNIAFLEAGDVVES